MRPASPARRILLTGASGLIGGELAGLLAARGHRVTALVRARREVLRNDGSAVPTTAWPEHRPGSVALATGDVQAPGFGLPEAAQAHDLLVHCAATTGFDLPEATHRAVNVGGTANAVALARAGNMALLHVSTAYAWGRRNGPVPEAPLEGPLHHTNFYEASKAEAEAAVRASGVRHAIARPSIVVGAHATGAIRAFDTFYAVFRLLARGRVRTLPATPAASLDLVPIDHVASGLLDLSERIDEAHGGIFHLVSGAPVTVQRFRDAIAAWPQFHAPELVPPEAFDPAALPAAERRLHARVMGLYAAYFGQDPRFEDAAARAFTGRACPPTDDAFLHRLAAFAIGAGFVPGPPA